MVFLIITKLVNFVMIYALHSIYAFARKTWW